MVMSNSLYLRLYDYCVKVKKSKRSIIRVALNEFLNKREIENDPENIRNELRKVFR